MQQQEAQQKGRSRSSNLRSKAERSDKITDSAGGGKKKRDMITMEHDKVVSAAGSRSHKVDKGPANAPKKRYSSSNGNKGPTGTVGSSASVKRDKRKTQE